MVKLPSLGSKKKDKEQGTRNKGQGTKDKGQGGKDL